MGYSGRYHAASLVAVFIALAIGILIGIGLGDDVVNGASEELEQSLRADLDDAEAKIEDLNATADQQRAFNQRVYPAVVDGRLTGSRVLLLGIGDLPRETATQVEDALEPTGGELGAVAVLSLPVDAEGLADAAPKAFAGARRGGEQLNRLGRELGRQMAGGGPVIDAASDQLFSRINGDLDGVDRVVIVRAPPGLEGRDQQDADALESGILDGLAARAEEVVGVEQSTTDPTTLGPLQDAGISTVDDIDQVAGEVSMVFALLGAEGSFGVKESADSLLPELLRSTNP